jgi:hypothetical protein
MIGVLKYYTAKAPEYSTSTYTAPSIYTVAPATQLCVLPQPTIPRLPSIKLCFSYYTDDPTYYTTKTSEYYTEAPKYYSSPGDTSITEATEFFVAPNHYTAALSYYI